MTCASVWDIKQVFLWFWWVSNDCFYSEVLLHVVSASCSCSNISHETRYFHVWVGAVQRDDTMTLSYPVRSFLHSHWCEYECIQIINMLVRSMIIVVCSPEYSLVIYLQHSVQVHRSCSAWCWSKVCFSGPFYRVTCLQRLILSVLLHLSSSQHTTCLFRAGIRAECQILPVGELYLFSIHRHFQCVVSTRDDTHWISVQRSLCFLHIKLNVLLSPWQQLINVFLE